VRPSSPPQAPSTPPVAATAPAAKSTPPAHDSLTPTARAISTKSTLIGIPAPSVVPPKSHATDKSTAPAAAAPAPAPSEPRSDTPVALSTQEPARHDAHASEGERSEPSATSTADAGSAKGDDERAKRPFSNTRADSPQAKGERARQNAPLRVSVPPRDTSNSLSRWLMVSLVIAALIMAGRWYLQSRAQKAGADAERTPVTAPAATDMPRATPLAPSAVVVPQVTETATEAPSAASATPAEPSAAVPSAESAPAPATRTVVVKISPPGARLFRKGKPVGSSPVTLELAPGEKRAFEVGMPGWVTRRLVVDGTKPEIFVGLKPER
jgi:hypothetical protein